MITEKLSISRRAGDTETNSDRRSAIFKCSEINLTPTVLRWAGRIVPFYSTWALTARFKMSLIRPISHSLTPCLSKGCLDTLLLEKEAKDTYLCLHRCQSESVTIVHLHPNNASSELIKENSECLIPVSCSSFQRSKVWDGNGSRPEGSAVGH